MSAWNGSNDYLLSENVYSRENQSNDKTPLSAINYERRRSQTFY